VKQSQSWITSGLGRTIPKTGRDGRVGLATYDLVFVIESAHPIGRWITNKLRKKPSVECC